MRLLHVTPSFYPATYYGGPTYSLYGLCNALSEQGVELRVLTTDTAGPGRKIPVENFPTQMQSGYSVYYCRKLLLTSISLGMLWYMIGLIRWADVIHLTGVYSFPTIPTLLACKLFRKPVVWSPRGSLQRWQGTTKPFLKALWEWFCRNVSPTRLVLHLTSEAEEREGKGKFPGIKTAIVPNGVEIPEKVGHEGGEETFRLLYLGRLHPKKGVENLLAALRGINGRLSWRLTLAGAGDSNYTKVIKQKIENLGLARQVAMTGEALGEIKRRLFETSDVVVVPSHTENFGMIVAEALAYGVPVIASRGTPWQRLEEIGCGLWVDNAPQSLARAIQRISSMPLTEMGRRGRQWMQREFSWDRIADQMVEVYRSLL